MWLWPFSVKAASSDEGSSWKSLSCITRPYATARLAVRETSHEPELAPEVLGVEGLPCRLREAAGQAGVEEVAAVVSGGTGSWACGGHPRGSRGSLDDSLMAARATANREVTGAVKWIRHDCSAGIIERAWLVTSVAVSFSLPW